VLQYVAVCCSAVCCGVLQFVCSMSKGSLFPGTHSCVKAMTHAYVGRDSFICKTHSYVSHDSLTSLTSLICFVSRGYTKYLYALLYKYSPQCDIDTHARTHKQTHTSTQTQTQTRTHTHTQRYRHTHTHTYTLSRAFSLSLSLSFTHIRTTPHSHSHSHSHTTQYTPKHTNASTSAKRICK